MKTSRNQDAHRHKQRQHRAPEDFVSTPRWRHYVPLFPALSADAARRLEQLPAILAKIRPLNQAHRQSLPGDIARLSRVLTSERSCLDAPYWSKPGFVSAYLYYFFPWNLIRLTRLFQALPLAPFPARPLMIDAGSGPLTVPVALWLARPDLRERELQILALDSSPGPLELGRKIFFALPGATPWKIRTETAPVHMLANLARKYIQKHNCEYWLVAMANVLNEFVAKKHCRGHALAQSEEHEEAGGQHPALDFVLEDVASLISGTSGQILFVEPGTRLGGTTIMRLRQAALEQGLLPAAPCTHAGACPLQTGATPRSASLATSWCHFTFAAGEVPDWLDNVTRKAGLAKKTLSLSTLLVRGCQSGANTDSSDFGARVISQGFAAAGMPGKSRYACAACGRCLMPNAANVPSGSLVEASPDPAGKKDIKSGARIILPSGISAGVGRATTGHARYSGRQRQY